MATYLKGAVAYIYLLKLFAQECVYFLFKNFIVHPHVAPFGYVVYVLSTTAIVRILQLELYGQHSKFYVRYITQKPVAICFNEVNMKMRHGKLNVKTARSFQLAEPHAARSALVVFVIGAVASVVLSILFNLQRLENVRRQLSVSNNVVSDAIVRWFSEYELILLGGSELFEIKPGLTEQNWQDFIETQNVEARFKGTHTVGYAEVILPGNSAAYLQKLPLNVQSSAQPKTKDSNTIYAPIMYAETGTRSKKDLIGRDTYADTARKTAMKLSAERNSPVLTRPTALFDEASRISDEPGLVIFQPVLVDDTKFIGDLQKGNVRGYVFASFGSEEMMGALLESRINLDNQTRVFVEEVTSNDPSVELYGQRASSSELAVSTTVNIAERVWQITTIAPKKHTTYVGSQEHVLLSGILLSIIPATVAYLLIQRRSDRQKLLQEAIVQGAKDDLIALASHQLRTPATGVKQYVGMVLQGFAGEVSEEQKNLLQKGYNANERQLATINNLLYAAKADAGQLALNPEEFNVCFLVKDVVDEMRTDAAAKGISLRLTAPKRIMAIGDIHYLRMGIGNIISNAIKYSHQDSVVNIKIAKTTKNRVCIDIADEGVGISEKDLAKLFVKFSRINNPLTRSTPGSGLGLFLAHRIIEAHDGKIRVKSQPDKGTTFSILLPSTVRKSSTKRKKNNRIARPFNIKLH